MKRRRISYILFLVGLTIFLYPRVYTIFNSLCNEVQIQEYNRYIASSAVEAVEENFKELQNSNNEIGKNKGKYNDPFINSDSEESSIVTTVNKEGIFGYLEIPKINEKLPIYLGATKENLAKGVAQIEKTSLPVGGVGTNSVIAGHRGFSYRAVFRYLDKLEKGDRFYLHIYGKILTYEVTGQEIIKPNQTEKLEIDSEKDQVTLLTCTPYRVSTHRLLIHSERVHNHKNIVHISESDTPANAQYSEVERSAVEDEIFDKSNGGEEISPVVRSHNIMLYMLVGFGLALWIVIFVMLIGTFITKVR